MRRSTTVADETQAYSGAPPSALESLLEDQVLALEALLLELRTDPEGVVHDARVALRRLRSSLSMYSRALVAEAAVPLRSELTWLAGKLGPARDAQVLLERMRVAVSLAGQGDPDAAALLAVFEEEEDEAFVRARDTLAGARFAALVARLDVARLRGLVAHDGDASGVTDRSLSRLVRDLETATGASDEHLHDLRKAVKRVRYARGHQDGVDVALKRVQSVLGEHQDSVVARQRLTDLARTPLVSLLLEREEELAGQTLAQLGHAAEKLRVAASHT